jgi:hypothetical protein
MKATRYLPLFGLVAVGLVVAAFIVIGETPDNKDSAAKIATWYRDNDSAVSAGGVLLMAAAAAFVVWAIEVRGLLWTAEGGAATRATLGLVGSVFFGAGLTVFAGLNFALGDIPERMTPSTIQALHVLSEDMFPMLAVGVLFVLLGYGLAIVATHAMPAWLGWLAIAGGVAVLTPAWFAPFIVLGVVIIVSSVLMVMHRGEAAIGMPRTPAPAA